MIKTVLVKKPHRVAFTGNPMVYKWQTVPYGPQEREMDLHFVARIKTEKNGRWDDAYTETLYPDANGMFTLDVSQILDPLLQFKVPDPAVLNAVACPQQRIKYEVTGLLQSSDLWDLPVLYPDAFVAVKGGLSREEWHPHRFFSQNVSIDHAPLRFEARGEQVDAEAAHWLYWMCMDDAAGAQRVEYTVFLADGTTFTHEAPGTLTGEKYGIYCAPAGFVQAGLQAMVGALQHAVRYSVAVYGSDSTVMAQTFFDLDRRPFYYKHFFVYRNSLGGLETLRLRGEVQAEGNYERTTGERVASPEWFGQPSLFDDRTREEFSYKGNTGFVSKDAMLKVRDFLLSTQKFEYTNGRLLPIVARATRMKFFSTADSLFAADGIEWSPAVDNYYYSPGSFLAAGASCPAVESFSVTQITRDRLNITWGLEEPYDHVEVLIFVQGTETTFTYRGNAGSVQQYFYNPYEVEPGDITVKCRTICSPDAVTPSFGPWEQITLLVYADSAPVAVDDHFEFDPPYNGSIFSRSVLANDYDPDGERLEAVPSWGMTSQGGWYSIDEFGVIDYAPHITLRDGGKDEISYQVRKAGGTLTATAKVFIHIGSQAYTVYVRFALRNRTYTQKEDRADVYLEFYSDAGCTVPVHVNALKVNYRITIRKSGHPPQEQNKDVTATGVAVFLGNTWLRQDITWNTPYVSTKEYLVMGGMGYEVSI